MNQVSNQVSRNVSNRIIAFEMLKNNTNGAVEIKDIENLEIELTKLQMKYESNVKRMKDNAFL